MIDNFKQYVHTGFRQLQEYLDAWGYLRSYDEDRMWALATAQGTAAAETALCDRHYDDESARGEAEARAGDDVLVENGFVDHIGNEQLICVVCGDIHAAS